MARSFEKYEIKGYEVVDNRQVMFSGWELTPEIIKAIETAEKLAEAAADKGYDRLVRVVKKYPHIPITKEVLISYHVNREEFEESTELNDELLEEHPDHLAGYINQALEYLGGDEIERIPEILTKNFDLKDLFPTRIVFHIQEFLAMQYVAVLYFIVNDETEKAWDRYLIMEKKAPKEVITGLARQQLFNHEMVNNEINDEFGEDAMAEGYLGPDVPEQPETTKTIMPKLENEIVQELYFHAYDEFPDGLLSKIAMLPHESLIADLETMVNDSFERFTYLVEEDWEAEKSFVTHAIFMLAEVNAIEKAPLIYKVLSQSYEYLDWFLDVVIQNDLYDPFYKLLAHDPDSMVAFLKKPGVANISRIIVLSVLKEIANQDPKQKLLVVNYHAQLLDFFIAAKPEDNVFDNMIMDALIAHLIMLKALQTLPRIKQAYEMDLVLNFTELPFDSIENLMQSPDRDDAYAKMELLSMEDTYNQIELYGDFDDDFDEELNDEYDQDGSDLYDLLAHDLKRPKGMSEKRYAELLQKAKEVIDANKEEKADFNRANMTVVKSRPKR